MPEIGNLFITLSAETASFDRGLKDANAKLTGFARQFDTIGKNISSTIATLRAGFAALGAGAAITAFTGWAKSMAEAGESAVNMANALGLTLAQVVELQGVFQLTTGTLEGASSAMRVFVGHVAEAMEKAGPARDNFRLLKIELADLNAKGNDPLEMLKLVADRLQAMPNGLEKAALGFDLFGKSAEKILPALQGGSEAIDDLAAKARALDPAAEAAKEAGERLDKKFDELGKAATGLSNEGLLLLEGKLGVVAGWLLDVTNAARDATSELRSLDNSAKAFATTWAGSVLSVISKLPSGSMWSVMANKLGLPLGADLATTPAKPAATATLPAVTVTGDRDRDYGGTGADRKRGGGGGGGKGGADRLAREAERDRAKRQREALEAIEEESRISDELSRRKEQALKHDADMDRISKEELIAAERKLLDDKWVATSQFFARKKQAAEGDADATRQIQNNEKLEYERFLTEREALSQAAAKRQHDTWKELFSDLGSSIKSSFEDIFDSLVEGTFKLRDAIGSLLKDIGKKLASRGFDMLLGGGSGGGGFGLLGKLFGSVFGSSIGGGVSNMSDLGFASGGSFQVGGAGAMDSQLVAFRASPGEMVDVHHGDRGGGGSQLVRIELNPSEGWVAGVADQRIVTRSGQIIDVAVRQSQKNVARNFAGMSAEAQARQM